MATTIVALGNLSTKFSELGENYPVTLDRNSTKYYIRKVFTDYIIVVDDPDPTKVKVEKWIPYSGMQLVSRGADGTDIALLNDNTLPATP